MGAITSYATMGSRGGSNGLVPEGRDITAGSFSTMGVPIVMGRNFNDGDRAADSAS
jgi:hypothetical protein